MASKIGNPIILTDLEYIVNVPLMLKTLTLNENHNKLLKAIVTTSELLDQITKRALQLNDGELIKILIKMSLLVDRS